MRDGKSRDGLTSALFLIGLGLLLLIPGAGVWPWILAVIGLAALPASLARKRGWYGWQSAFWLVGLAVLFAADLFWPGILVLVGLSALLGALTREAVGSPFASQSNERAEPFARDDDQESSSATKKLIE